ncbi:MAG: DNA topoisomerase VI subunit B [Desulfurococcales archaeon]|nr:DNA topoisomerase VI subunit B [Desulfurococcales archaeon]
MARRSTTAKNKGNSGETKVQGSGEKYRAMSPAEFFSRYKELAGFSNPTRAVYQTIRELVENALDATDTHGLLPVIRVIVRKAEGFEEENRYTITVEDNGIGVPPTVMADAFGRVLYSSKYVIRQTRGMFGLGVKAAVIYGQQTAGRPVTVVSSMADSDYVYMKRLFIDINENKPRIIEEGQWRKKGQWHGTRVSITIEGDWRRARSRVIEYVKRTAIVAPYAEIHLETPDGEVYIFPRMTRKMPRPPREAKPHPHGVNLEQFKMILQSTTARTLKEMLVTEFQSVGARSAEAFLRDAGIRPNVSPKTLLRREYQSLLVRLVDKLRSYKGFRGPRSDYLSPIGEDLIELGLKRMFHPEFVSAVTRPARSYMGHPFIVEVGLAYGGSIPSKDEPILLRYANKIPLLYGEREDVSYKVISSVNWKNYYVEFPAPLVVLVHIASTRIPYKEAGKESIGDVPEIESEIRAGVWEVARRLRIFLSRKRREAEVRRKIITLAKYIPEVARSLAMISKPPEKWSPPRPEDEEKLVEALVKLVARNVELPNLPGVGDGTKAEDIVRMVIAEVKTE